MDVGNTVGRDRERAFAEEVLAAARRHLAVLLLEGEAGIGKTTVWRETILLAEARGFHVLACRPTESEAKLSLSGIADLLERVPEETFGALGESQRHALEVALLRTDPGETPLDERAVTTAVRSLLAVLATVEPVVIAIDDVQWLDAASAAILDSALRRLTAEHVALVVARRLGEPVQFRVDDLVPPERLIRTLIGPLTLGALHQVLKQRLRQPLPRSTLIRIHRASAGNPLFALEVGRLLNERGIPCAGALLPVPSDVRALVRRRVTNLPASALDVLLFAAALAEPQLDTIRAALGRTIELDLETADRAEIAAVEGDRVRFAHPLFSAAILSSVTASERRRTHHRLAEVVQGSETRARHLAHSVEGPDEATAAVVHAAAREALVRGLPRGAVELLELSLSCGLPGTEAEATRLLDLATCLQAVGELARAREILESVPWVPELHARAVARLCEVIAYTEDPAARVGTLERMLRQSLPAEGRAAIHAGLSHAASSFDAERAAEEADAALALLETLGEHADPAIHAVALYMSMRAGVLRGRGLDRDLVARVLQLEARLSPERRLLDRVSAAIGFWFKHVDDLEASRTWLEAELRELEDEPVREQVLLEHLAVTECWAGNLELARRHALSSLAQSEPASPTWLRARSALALVEAHLGNVEDVRALAGEADATEPALEIRFRGALGLVDLALGNYEAADAELWAALETTRRLGWREPGMRRVHADAAEAAIALGDLERADGIGETLRQHGERTNHRWSRATGARVQALAAAARGDLEGALAAADRALAAHEGLSMPFELARTLLVKGRIERRARLRTRAKQSFEQAADIFESIGARLWAERARNELDRVGLRRTPAGGLTVNERRVAELAAQGMTNREVAAALFLSTKTVEANLSRAYRKLGIRSRAELGARLSDLVQT